MGYCFGMWLCQLLCDTRNNKALGVGVGVGVLLEHND